MALSRGLLGAMSYRLATRILDPGSKTSIAVQKDVRTLSNFFHVLKHLVKESKNVLTLVRRAIVLNRSQRFSQYLYYSSFHVGKPQ